VSGWVGSSGFRVLNQIFVYARPALQRQQQQRQQAEMEKVIIGNKTSVHLSEPLRKNYLHLGWKSSALPEKRGNRV
jgi:hypothetical protein